MIAGRRRRTRRGTATSRPAQRPRLLATSEGSSREAFAAVDWAMLATVAGFWGASFLLMAIALDHFAPGLTVTLRLSFSIGVLLMIPQARRRIAWSDWPQTIMIGLVWMVISYVSQALAQARIDSALAGMLSGAVPIYGALFAAILLRRLPGRWQGAGLLLGFGGIALMALPNALEASGTAEGVGFIVAGSMGFALATSLVIPLQHRYGAPAVILNAQLVGLVVTLPYGVLGALDSTWNLGSFAAMATMGSVQSGIAVVVMSVLVGRVGATRGGVTMYFVPLVAITLGVTVRDDSVKTLALAGIVLVLIGAYLTTRRDTARTAGAGAAAGNTRPRTGTADHPAPSGIQPADGHPADAHPADGHPVDAHPADGHPAEGPPH